MDEKSIEKILSGDSKDIQNLRKGLETVQDFLILVNRIDALPEANRRMEGISPFQAVVRNVPLQKLEGFFIAFFGAPAKRAGEPPPFKLKFNPAVKYLGEIRTEQTFFTRKLKNGEFYGAIWPWVRKPKFQTLHLGYYSKTLSDDDFQRLEELIKKSTHQRLVGEMEAGIGGQIHGISLPAFLQMSEMEKTTATLKVRTQNKNGIIYIRDGILVDAKTGGLTGKEAAYRIISWDNAGIEIDKAAPKMENVIKEPLMHILMESLKIKDEEEFQQLGKQPEADEPIAEVPEDEQDFDEGEPGEDEDDGFIIKMEDKRFPLHKWLDDPIKKRRLKFLAYASLLLIILSVGVFFASRIITENRLETRYRELMSEVGKQKAFKEKEILLKMFINSTKSDEYADTARKKLAEIKTTMDETLYEQVTRQIDALPLTFDYDKKAKAVYSQYTEQFPDGKYIPQIKEGINRIPEIIDDTQYEYLTGNPWKSEDEKIVAYKEYLINHPAGKHREAVEQVLVEVIEKRFEEIQRQQTACEKRNEYASCIELCDNFLAVFENTYRTEEVRTLKNTLQGRRDMAGLRLAAAALGENYHEIKKVYVDYLDKNPDSAIRDDVSKEVERLTAMIEEKDSWQSTLKYIKNPKNDISGKIARVDKYLTDDPSGPYRDEARATLVRLHKERQEQEEKRAMALELARKADQTRNKMLSKQQQKARLDSEVRRMAQRLQPLGNRYRNNGNGTFRDANTGLTWCMLDSDIVLGQCIDYKSAVAYVNSLTTGGYRDWRLPTASELAQIYKDKPFFPAYGFRRFWTSEVVIKGYHEMVGTVSSKQETVFSRDLLSTKECATVHAVRR